MVRYEVSFSFFGSGLSEFDADWNLACEWVRLVPQLFFVHYDAHVEIPSNCARIDLVVEYL